MKQKKCFQLYLKIVCIFALLVSCSSDNDDEVNDNRYYIRYEVTFTTKHSNAERKVNFTTENGHQSVSLEGKGNSISWEGTYGPVSKNFTATLECNTGSYQYSNSIHGRIYVSREKEPFVIKAEGEQSNRLSLNYKIDF